jgi:hypothetical protein
MPKLLTPIHPGEIIREEVLVPLDLSVNQLAKSLAIGSCADDAASRPIQPSAWPVTLGPPPSFG